MDWKEPHFDYPPSGRAQCDGVHFDCPPFRSGSV